MTRTLFPGVVGLGLSAFIAASLGTTSATHMMPDVIVGTVSSSAGPEAGVWVIAETTDLPTRYIKEVVTDNQGRYLIPALPKARYTVWARGYGLVDSPKVETEPGKRVDLKPSVAPDAKSAAHYYPANYWYSLLEVPAENEFPGTSTNGNGISPNIKTQAQWIHLIKTDSCESCHQLGNQYTRTIPAMFSDLPSAQAWMRRLQSGQAGSAMMGGLAQLGPQRATQQFGDWTTRIANGELPAEAPPRPQGIERNVVITQWDWADPKAYLHDEISTDKRYPSVNANGLIYGSPEESRDYLPVLDPVHSTISQLKVQYRDPDTPGQPKPLNSSPIWGDEAIWDSHTTVHNPMFDERGRLWFTARIRANDNPAFCKAGSSLISAMLTPVRELRPPTGDVRSGDEANCHDRYLLRHAPPGVRLGCQQYAVDQQRRWWRRRGLVEHEDVGPDARRAEIARLDCSGAGHQRQRQAGCLRGRRTESGDRAQRRESGNFRGVQWSDRSTKDTRSTQRSTESGGGQGRDGVGFSVLGFPGGIVRLNPGSNPPETALAEYYEVPWNDPKAAGVGLLAARAWMSTATVWSGWRWEAGIWRASTGASAKVRLTGRMPPASNVRKGGRSIRRRDRTSRT